MPKLDLDQILATENLSENEEKEVAELIQPDDRHRNLTRLPVIFVVDVSYSMGGEPLNQVNNALSDFFNTISNPSDELSRQLNRQADFAIVTYGETVDDALKLTSANQISGIPTLYASGATPMGTALIKAGELMLDALRSYKINDMQSFCGYIFNLTDGLPTDMQEGDTIWQKVGGIVDLFETMGSRGTPRAQFVHFGTESADFETLKKLTFGYGDHRVLELKNSEIHKLMDFVSITLSGAFDEKTLDEVLQERGHA